MNCNWSRGFTFHKYCLDKYFCDNIEKEFLKIRDLKPPSYSATVKILLNNAFISNNLGENLNKMIKFRNKRVHISSEVDIKTLCEILQENLDDFELFIREITVKIFGDEC